MNLLSHVKQYQNDDLCKEWNNNIPLHVLSKYNDQMTYSELSQDIQSLCDVFSFLPSAEITGYVCTVIDGDYGEVYVTEWSRPYDLQAIYHPLAYYL